PGRIFLPQETLGFRRAGFSPALSLLIPAFSLARAPALLTVCLRRGVQRSSTERGICDLRFASCDRKTILSSETANRKLQIANSTLSLLRYPAYSRSFTALLCSTSKLLRTF